MRLWLPTDGTVISFHFKIDSKKSIALPGTNELDPKMKSFLLKKRLFFPILKFFSLKESHPFSISFFFLNFLLMYPKTEK